MDSTSGKPHSEGPDLGSLLQVFGQQGLGLGNNDL